VRLRGHLHRIDDLPSVAGSFIAGSEVSTGAINFGPARVRCVVQLPSTVERFVPTVVFSADTDAAGRFSVEVPDDLAARNAHLVAFTQSGTVPIDLGQNWLGDPLPDLTVPVFVPVYRSEPFALAGSTEDVRHLHVALATVPDESGLTQADVTAQADALAAQEGLGSVSARIRRNRVDIRAERDGGVVRFELRLRPDVSADLTRFVRTRVDDIDVDLPGIDWITGLCADADDVERQVRGAVRDLDDRLNEQIGELVPAALAPFAGVTLRAVRHPVTESVQVPVGGLGQTVPVSRRSIVGDPCVGFPRLLYP
jgi:hypothetical protein